MNANQAIGFDIRQARPSQAFAQALDPRESLGEGIGQGYGVLSYKGKVWSLRYRGQVFTFTRPDDGTPVPYIDVVILRAAHSKSKSWYENGYEIGVEGRNPDCSSIDSVVPDPTATKPQAQQCALCPRNVWKTQPNGRQGRECTDYKRYAVLLMPHQTQAFFGGTPLMEPVFLRVPPASLGAIATYGDTMASQGFPFASVVTRVNFDPNKPHPEFQFRAVAALTDQDAPVILPLTQDQTAIRIVGEDQTRNVTALPPPPNTQQLAAPPQQPVQAPATPPPLYAPAAPPPPPQPVWDGQKWVLPAVAAAPVNPTPTSSLQWAPPPATVAPSAAPPQPQATLQTPVQLAAPPPPPAAQQQPPAAGGSPNAALHALVSPGLAGYAPPPEPAVTTQAEAVGPGITAAVNGSTIDLMFTECDAALDAKIAGLIHSVKAPAS